MTTSTTGYKVIGTRPLRHDGVDKVTGRALYGADVQMAGLLHGRILRSPIPHGLLRSLDASKALELPGVEAVVTCADLTDPGDRIAELGEGAVNLKHLSSNCLARGKVHYKGQAVAAVAAVSAHLAEEALKLIAVEYEGLPHVTDVRAAMQDGAPLLHDDLVTESLGKPTGKRSNIAKHIQFKKGDVAQGFQQAAVVIEREFHTATVHQGYIEPHNATALWNADGTVTIWCSTQGAFTVRAQVAELLGIPLSRIKVVPMEIGGGFGGKIRVYLEPVAAALSKKTGKPVKITMNRADVFEATGPTPGSYIKVKMGADKDGKLVAARATLAYEAGAFPGSPLGPGAMCIFACYDIPNVHIDGYDVVVNKPATSAYRAPGATNAAFASETVVDELCEHLKIDPLDFRIQNGAREGTRRADGPVFPRIGMVETAQTAKQHAHYTAPLGPNPKAQISNPKFEKAGDGANLGFEISGLRVPRRGRGVASGFWFNCGLKSSASASVNADGTVSLVEGSTDIGGSRTSIAMQLAESLGIRADDVRPAVGDTDTVGYTDVTGGSRVTFATGWAAYEAGQDIKRQMIARAALLWGVQPEAVAYEDGTLRCLSDDKKRLTFKELSEKLHATGGTIVGRASVDPPGVGGGFATHVVDVEVDPETGKVTVLRYTAVQDVGKAIHPSYVEGQMQGGVVQGIGWALNEEYIYNEQGVMTNASFLDYRMPTALDLPMIDTVLVEVANPGHPYGVRGVGEVPIVPPPAALANAIYQALGVRMDELPMSPGRVMAKLLAKQ
ncbi:MAG: xanthine dehydrogenase family protein molybdopterin-binding subunit [Planctomycetes bacterium]|nr:xanthine dehydrogenase family protein molybdopterin-binding subunit [Planctomycetota bacterium]